MAMSRKHYIETAAAIKELVDSAAELTPVRRAVTLDNARAFAHSMAYMFVSDNRAFDRNKFMDACGLSDPRGN